MLCSLKNILGDLSLRVFEDFLNGESLPTIATGFEVDHCLELELDLFDFI